MLRLAVVAYLFSTLLCFAQAPKRQMRSMHMPDRATAEDNEIFLSYWTVEPDWHSEAQLRNNSVSDPLVVTPVLRSGGEEFPMPALTIAPQDTAVVNLHEVVGSLKRTIPQPFGSVVLRFHSAYPRQLYAAVMLHRESSAIAFHVDGAGKLSQASNSTTKEGIWWLPTDSVDDSLVITNQGNDAAPVQIRLTNAAGAVAIAQLDLQPRQTLRNSVRALLAQQHVSGTYGGIQIRPLAHAEAVDALAFAIDEHLGFGAMLKMFDRDPDAAVAERDFVSSSQFTLRAPMLALASADASLAIPAGTELHPLILVRNVADHSATMQLQFNWTGDTWKGTTKGPVLSLGPRETRLVGIESLPDAQKPPALAHWTSVYLSSEDSLPDDVLAVAASYDSSFRYGAQTPFSDQLSSVWKGGEWQYDGLHDSIITIGNATSTPTRALFTLFYNHANSRYEVEKALGPNEQMWIDVGTLIKSGVADSHGNVLPSNITAGSYEFRDMSKPSRASLFEGKVIYDKTNGHASYGCAACCAARSVYLNYNPLYVATNGSFTNGVSDLDDCGNGPEDVSSYFYNWTTQSTSIATTTSQGVHTGVAPGGTTSFTQGQILHTNGRNGCYYISAGKQGPTNTVTVSVSPNTIVMSNGDTSKALSVTVTPSSAASLTAISYGQLSNPNSSSQATLGFTPPSSFTGNDSWPITVSGSNSPSTISTATACASTACSTGSTSITIPPQVLIQVLYGEAHGQAVSGDTVSEPAVAASIKNRLSNSGFGSPTSWQAAITAQQFNGINTTITTGQEPELDVATAAYSGISTDITGGSPCFFTPDSSGFAAIQNAYNTGATTVPIVNSDPKCYGSNRQFVWKTSIGNNIALPGIPAFIFERQKVGNAAVVQIP